MLIENKKPKNIHFLFLIANYNIYKIIVKNKK